MEATHDSGSFASVGGMRIHAVGAYCHGAQSKLLVYFEHEWAKKAEPLSHALEP